jgi:acyl carrier protein
MRTPTATSLRSWMCERIAARRQVGASEIDPDADFTSLGLDSMAVVELTGELASSFGIAVDPTIVYDFPTVRSLALELARAGAAPRGAR